MHLSGLFLKLLSHAPVALWLGRVLFDFPPFSISFPSQKDINTKKSLANHGVREAKLKVGGLVASSPIE